MVGSGRCGAAGWSHGAGVGDGGSKVGGESECVATTRRGCVEKGDRGCGGVESGEVGKHTHVEVARDTRAFSNKVVEETRWRGKKDAETRWRVGGGTAKEGVRWRAKGLKSVVIGWGASGRPASGVGKAELVAGWVKE